MDHINETIDYQLSLTLLKKTELNPKNGF